MAEEKCPYCYRPLSAWKKNPILVPNGSKYKWSDSTHLVLVPNEEDRIYKGIYQVGEDEIIELQDKLKELEEENLDEGERTEFSPINTSGKFQITGKHIKEMRDSVEKLLDKMGLEKKDYFNYDEDGNHIIHPKGDKLEWTDPITEATDLTKFQIKAIHIEDLRHNIQLIWQETWEKGITEGFSKSTFVHVGSWYEGKEEYFNFEADHNWKGKIVSWAAHHAGAAWGEATSTFYFNKLISPSSNIRWVGQAKAKAWGALSGASASASLGDRAHYNSLYTIIDSPRIKITPNTRLQFRGTNFYSWDYTISGSCVIPPVEPNHYIMVTVNFSRGTIRYVLGTPSGAEYEILITEEEFLNFDRNLYEDYILSHNGTPPSLDWKYISSIGLRGITSVSAGTCGVYPTWDYSEKEIESNLEFTIDDIKLYYKTV